ncbi:MAG: pyroglutamyl-peptidase [Verrucomicrobiota bacterium]|jgi:pyroglutamyl-peptidase
MKKILITGFEPFAGARVNPSEEIARALDGRVVAGHQVIGAVLPCVFGGSIAELKRWLKIVRPELVICVGQAGGRKEITPERVAINVDDARIADNSGAQPIDTPVARGGPAAYWSTLPIKAIVAALHREGLPAAISQTAGTFVCNHLFYGLMRALARRPGVRGGFIHVPFLPQQAKRGQPSLKLCEMITGLTVVARTAITTQQDLAQTGGQTH